jgi:dihydropteroate synthase
MHMRGTPQPMQNQAHYQHAPFEIAAELADRVKASLKAGIALSRILIDPGLGFGKRPQDNWDVLTHLDCLRSFGRPLFVGASRKSFLGALLDGRAAAERDDATSATTAHLVRHGVAAIRVHDARRAADVARVSALLAEKTRPQPWFPSECSHSPSS